MGTVKIPIYIYTLRMSFLSLVCSFCVPFLFFHKIKKTETPVFTSIQVYKKAGDERIELPPKVLETPIIPFDQSPTLFTLYIQNFIQISDFLSSLIPTYSLIRMLHRKTLARFRFATSRYVLLRKTLHEHSTISADESARCFHVHSSSFSAFSRLSPRPISNSQLHVLPHFHRCPIYLVVFKGSYSRRRDISS